MSLHISTAIQENHALNRRLNKNIYFKMECYQPTGSFKMRGIGALCEQAIQVGKTHLVSSSGGNAGYAAAYAGRKLGTPVTVVVPHTTSPTAIERMQEQEAKVIVHGEVWNDADSYARDLVAQHDNYAYIHPFDNPRIWTGHSSIIEEAVQQMPKSDAVVVAVGGGGLMAGILQGMHACGWQDVPLIAVETDGAGSFYASYQAKELVRIDKITSIAKTLGALQVTSKLMDWVNNHPITPVLVSDKSAVDACLAFADDFRVLTEPACGAALSLAYGNSSYLENYNNILMIVCGGAGAKFQQLLKWQEELS
ncbi:MAG: hypothetical protein Phog2KO_28920 [Phototrophicaceae bacterium]